mmetsp:Transcript_14487/g.49475  ORF Transcript_14487/g.49475 Transcript_14487/m.49475 type:complete len:233 (+) Transcript_14487:540-1238(+)
MCVVPFSSCISTRCPSAQHLLIRWDSAGCWACDEGAEEELTWKAQPCSEEERMPSQHNFPSPPSAVEEAGPSCAAAGRSDEADSLPTQQPWWRQERRGVQFVSLGQARFLVQVVLLARSSELVADDRQACPEEADESEDADASNAEGLRILDAPLPASSEQVVDVDEACRLVQPAHFPSPSCVHVQRSRRLGLRSFASPAWEPTALELETVLELSVDAVLLLSLQGEELRSS